MQKIIVENAFYVSTYYTQIIIGNTNNINVILLTNHVVEVVDDHLGVVGGVHGALQERRPRAQLRLLSEIQYIIAIKKIVRPIG